MKSIILLLVAVLLLFLAACSAPVEQIPPSETIAPAVTEAPTPALISEPTPEVLAGDINEDGKVVYGLLAYDTDSNIFSGTAFEYAAELIGVQTESEIIDIEAYYDGKVTESIKALVDEDVDGICFVSLGIVELDDNIAKECSEANVPFVIIGADTQTHAVAKVDCDITEAGKLLGEYTVQQYSGADVAKIISIKDTLVSQKINEAFDTVLEDNGNAIIDEREAYYDPSVAKEVLWDMIKDNGKDNVQFPVIFFENANMMMPSDENESMSHVFLTFLQWGVEEKLDTVCIIGDDEGLDLFENGLGNGENGVYHIDYAVANNYGLLEAMSLLTLHLYNAGELEEGSELLLPPVVLDRDNPETLKQASSEPDPAWIDYIEENFPTFFESIISLAS